MLKVLLASTVLTMSMAGMAQAAGDAAAGEAKSAVCAACHGKDGIALVPIYPNLRNQNAAYLEGALKAYREGQRTGGNAAIMSPMAKNLSDQDIADLAAYYSSME
ncbi:cytochrome c [uncultured Halopseudomonas sp.]|uniref:c-type cytochrome n=1 Tax=uncultured Halopseudomonas sp. TaxID=2901193 RepID=UPI0030ECBCA7|tara:strand:- start:16305 stop:16619 length:315 start_codon:yes stop_codon:yes gene_type:complete